MPTSDARGRVHIVLVPGFAGFDALGQIEYYADVTSVFQRWRSAAADGRAVLHYFDNLPTAGVATRAVRLAAWLAKRVARSEFQGRDQLALVGHSTGGLDIRRVIRDLTAGADPVRHVDGARALAARVPAERILGMRPRLVFLSVPQRGTNIADFVRTRGLERAVAVGWLRANVAAARLPAADELQRWVAGHAAALSGSDLFRAVRDAFAEIDPDAVPGDAPDRPTRIAAAQEAESEIALWLRHMATDFGAIDDLAAAPPAGSRSPAHFDEATRAQERFAWSAHGIATRSYATVSPRPFRFEGAGPLPAWNPYDLFSRPPETGLAQADAVYRACYRACAGGPFAVPGGAVPPLELFAGHGEPWPLAAWDNDGIVNTASMLWPDGGETRLVHADHGDVIGHFRLERAAGATGREFHTYDLLGSGARFEAEDFERVWRDVFEFCVGG